MNYPLISEYIESIKSAEDNFEELSSSICMYCHFHTILCNLLFFNHKPLIIGLCKDTTFFYKIKDLKQKSDFHKPCGAEAWN